MKLVVGLGNPGKDYQNTRHNVGQMAISALAQKLNLSFNANPKLQARLALMGQGSDRIIFATLDSYMNLSGGPVQKILSYYKIDPANLYVIHDDLDLGVGEWKDQFDRGAAGHNGIKSIMENLGTQAFHRLRIGIGHPRNKIASSGNVTGRAAFDAVEDYVLLPFSPDEKVLIQETIGKIVNDFDNWARS